MANATTNTKGRTKRMKWTEQMNLDCLDSKRKALDMIGSENPPLNENGKRRGYIKVMKELWDERGYEYLGLSCQNLRDQAARLEKTMGDTIVINSGNGIKENVETTEGSLNYGSSSGSQHKSSSGSQHDIQFDDIIDNAIEDQYEDTMRSLRSTSANSQEGVTINTSLPEHEITEKPAIIKWGKDKNGVLINIQSSDIIKAYEEIILWRKNVFLVPYGKIGK